MKSTLDKTINDIREQEVQLKAKKEKARRFAIEEVNGMIRLFGIQQSELNFSAERPAATPAAAGKRVARKARSNAGTKVAPKFRTPEGATWSGRGLMPKVLKAAVERGISLEDMRIQPDGTTLAETMVKAE